ncbi:hypothetical protein ACSDR0_50720, partial [Streptosporangium sp. G11]|uniref:hypothetical protein n=1 Tax=Streptosporangium sp. G11 TaxID=3436926 RepID=UPI003EC0A2C8
MGADELGHGVPVVDIDPADGFDVFGNGLTDPVAVSLEGVGRQIDPPRSTTGILRRPIHRSTPNE